MSDLIEKIISERNRIAEEFFNKKKILLYDVGEKISQSLKNGRKILIFGNGGSAADSQHFAAELVNKFKKKRRAIPSIALTTDTSILTSVGNDSSFDEIFSRQIEALGDRGDWAIGISTSGVSTNVIRGIEKARELGLYTLALTGEGGGKLKSISEYLINVPSNETPRIQEFHILILHIIAEIIENEWM